MTQPGYSASGPCTLLRGYGSGPGEVGLNTDPSVGACLGWRTPKLQAAV